VVQFVGFLGAYREPGTLSPLASATCGALLTTWVTFAPCFLWIFAGAPYIERLRGSKSLSTALSAITAAVVGVVLNLAVWFGIQTLVRTTGTGEALHRGIVAISSKHTLDLAALTICIAACLAMLRYHVNLILTLGASALAGAIFYFVCRL
jgi:chromate transporter